jgi:hypothetical protein
MCSVAVRAENGFGDQYLKINGLNTTKFYSCKHMGSVAVRVENDFGDQYLKINGLNITKFYSCIV